MEKTLRNVEVDPDKFAILRSPKTQKLLAMARYLMRLTLNHHSSFQRALHSASRDSMLPGVIPTSQGVAPFAWPSRQEVTLVGYAQ
jgi:hypothetical protein